MACRRSLSNYEKKKLSNFKYDLYYTDLGYYEKNIEFL